MSDVEQETYLHKTRAEAWDAFMKRYSSTGDAGQIFAAAAEVYERELRVHLDVDEASDRDYAAELRAVSEARDLAYEVLDELDPERPMAARLRRLITQLDKLLGPDLVREADPTGTVLKSLPYEQRKRMLDAIDSGPKVIEVPEPLELHRLDRDEVAERLSDYLTQLGIDPDETFEGDPRTTAQILADVALAEGSVAVEVGSPEHQAAERVTVAQMAAEDVARGEGG